MNQTHLATQLASKFLKQEMAPLIIFQTKDHALLQETTDKMLSDIIGKHFGVSPETAAAKIKAGLADILFMKPDSDHRYLVEHFKELFSFVNYSPLELPGKLVIILHGELISEVIFNKLLKIFEEPQNNTSFILQVETDRPLLETITSRAITLQLRYANAPKLEEHEQNLILDWSEGRLSTSKLVDMMKEKKEISETLFVSILEEALKQSTLTYQELESIEALYHSFSKRKRMNMLAQDSHFCALSLLKKHVSLNSEKSKS